MQGHGYYGFWLCGGLSSGAQNYAVVSMLAIIIYFSILRPSSFPNLPPKFVESVLCAFLCVTEWPLLTLAWALHWLVGFIHVYERKLPWGKMTTNQLSYSHVDWHVQGNGQPLLGCVYLAYSGGGSLNVRFLNVSFAFSKPLPSIMRLEACAQ